MLSVTGDAVILEFAAGAGPASSVTSGDLGAGTGMGLQSSSVSSGGLFGSTGDLGGAGGGGGGGGLSTGARHGSQQEFGVQD